MRKTLLRPLAALKSARRLALGVGRDRRGTTAIEFGLVALPFFVFTFGIIAASLNHFVKNSLEHAVDTASRKVRTCQAQNSGMTVGGFKDLVHEEASSMIDKSKMNVLIQRGATWQSITPQACVDSSGVMTNSTGSSGDALSQHAGGAGEVVLITVCYEWDLAKSLPYFFSDDLANGSSVIQAVATFRTEPCQ